MAVVTTLPHQFRVNANVADAQGSPFITRLTGGGYVVVWERGDADADFKDVYLQRYGANGIQLGFEVQVNSRIPGDQASPAVAALATGGFVVTWQEDTNLYARVHTNIGGTTGADIKVNVGQVDTLQEVGVTTLANGNFLIAWAAQDGPDGAGVYASLFNAAGAPIEREFLLVEIDGESEPRVAALDDGGFVMSWSGFDGVAWNVYSRRFDADGDPLGAGPAIADSLLFDSPQGLNISALEGGGYVVCWSEWVLLDVYTISSQLYDAAGNAVGGVTPVNNTGGSMWDPSVAALADGGYVIAWYNADFTHTGDTGVVYARRFDASGNPIGDSFTVNDDGPRTTGGPTVTGLADGGFMIVWGGVVLGDAADSYYILGQRYDARGTALHAVLQGDASNDVLSYAGGAAQMSGAAGNDTYVVNDAGDSVIEHANQGTDVVHSAVTFTLGENVENLMLTGTAPIWGTGNNLINVITGNAGANRLTGGAGLDSLRGGLGNDVYICDQFNEVTELANGGVDTIFTTSNYTLGDHQENLALTGANTVNGGGNTLNNLITGNAANNVLNGKDGVDTLNGAAGNDALVGGAGNDTLSGGAGFDSFRFDAALGATNMDRILDFVAADDAIILENAIFASLTATGALNAASLRAGAGVTTAADANDYIICNTTTGDIYYDQDGSGAAFAAVRFANIGAAAATTLTAADIVVV